MKRNAKGRFTASPPPSYKLHYEGVVTINGIHFYAVENGCMKYYPDGTRHFISNERHD